MSDIMTPIPFKKLMNHILSEYQSSGNVFSVPVSYKKSNEATYSIFGEKLETVFGPAAGPHTQLTQNIVASYFAGSRFFELKTVQKLDGEDLPVAKPCIKADDECYNVEWSTELLIPDAYNEYIKAWFALKVIAKEFDLGASDGFVFNMSVGYDLDGIKTPKIDKFIEGMKDASNEPIFAQCKEVLKEMLPRFKNVDEAYIDSISPKVCRSVTLSTLHGCPPAEIERIATYLINEKGLNTFIKCNPTLLGYEYARKTLDDMGYDYIVFDDFHFRDDLQYGDAVPMLERLISLAESKGVTFGVKLTNTFPVTISRNELPGGEMYMSGRSLYPLTVSVADKLSKDFGGKLKISFSGGIDAFNASKLFECGIWPITMATTFLKPGGYGRMVQIAKNLEDCANKLHHSKNTEFTGVDLDKLASLKEEAINDPRHIKDYKPMPEGASDNSRLYRARIKPETSRKLEDTLPLLDCFIAPCSEGCPIHQNIPEYIRLAGVGKYKEALDVITQQNPLPFITGTICSHFCMSKCTRMFYEDSVKIRSTKLECAEKGFDEFIKTLKPNNNDGEKVAVIGGGPAGISVAYFLARAGKAVTIFEKREQLGGIVRYVIPEFRIASESIDKDIELIKAMGVEIRTNTEVRDISELEKQGFKDIVIAIGAYKGSRMTIEGATPIPSLEFLEKCKKGELSNAESIVVIGGGNTAMDCARAAKRTNGVKNSFIVYRRTMEYMPADSEEIMLAANDGVKFYELLSPEKIENGKLRCRRMVLGEPDSSGRRSPVSTDEFMEIPCDLVVTATGEKPETEIFESNKLEKSADTSTNKSNVFVIGDCLKGPATVVEAIRDAKLAAEKISGCSFEKNIAPMDEKTLQRLAQKKTVLKDENAVPECERCLECNSYCENCVTVCPNRANVAIKIKGKAMPQILHIDIMCNECGNCKSFCPYSGAPYLDKLTLFADEKGMEESKNHGFCITADGKLTVRLFGNVTKTSIDDLTSIPEGVAEIIRTVYNDYSYLL